MSNAPALLKLSRVADLLGLSTKTVRRLIERRELVAIRVGGQWRVDPRDLAAYLARGRSNAGAVGTADHNIPNDLK